MTWQCAIKSWNQRRVLLAQQQQLHTHTHTQQQQQLTTTTTQIDHKNHFY